MKNWRVKLAEWLLRLDRVPVLLRADGSLRNCECGHFAQLRCLLIPNAAPQYVVCCSHGCDRQATMKLTVEEAVEDWNDVESKVDILDAKILV